MHSNIQRLAIYSGSTLSTTFIERLVVSLARNGFSILLFGSANDKRTYPSSVKVLGYHSHPLGKLLYFLRYWLLLYVFKRSDKKKLDALLVTSNGTPLLSRLQAYSVLWYRPDVFHVSDIQSVANWVWLQHFGVKLVLSLWEAHNNDLSIDDPGLVQVYQRYFSNVDGFHVAYKTLSAQVQEYGILTDKTQVIYSGLNLEKLQFVSEKSSSSKFRVLSVGCAHWKKGYTYALDACGVLKEEAFPFVYKILGIEDDVELLYHIQDLDVENDVQLLAPQSMELVSFYLEEADVLLFPSVKEGIANVVLEAMALGTVVISTDCGGMDEVIEDGVNGFLVPVRDAKALAEKVKYVAGLPEERLEAIRGEARKTIELQHSLEVMVEGMEGLYGRLTINNE
ncbi:glycosyltransferase family 4 protein [Mangrovimonas sp. AS39]|uniref:glycosyltransferase family 4 protein n=1 Tax=Mangrovimonas futianensis TaxID=2895523 RepID=UPI001E59B860|nr:glycosyltransferase family 4 protein [Mangrovimonas futianensis]MCF1191224.1 glycosyltransferase family 4 protein [Mangrovimonas futianensis]MCF1194919.1 glycosyltransferase family 4 protein [Mangrovimonas futianensis]